MRRQFVRGSRPLLLAVVLATALFFAPSMIASAVPMLQQLPPMGGQPLDQLQGDDFDQAFLAQMTMHHAMGVMMTQPVVDRGAHQELKALGAQMIADQSREIGVMRGWLQAWYGQDVACPMVQGSSPGMMPGWMPGAPGQQPGGMMPGQGPWMMPGGRGPGGMGPGMMPGGMMPGRGPGMMPGGLWSLPPDQLDETFMTSMIEHHQGAIDMATLAGERSAHQEIKDLATSIITSQSAEITMMQGWLATWYGR
jgi:uncharacterized protein (DUF305 family)